MEQRFEKNIDEILTEDLQYELLTKNIAVIGCGGQGGYILEYLIRLGVKSITFWDGDEYTVSNLNRQIGCTEQTIGKNKAEILALRLNEINSQTTVNARNWFFGDKENDFFDLLQMDLIFMAADCYYNIIKMRTLLKKALIQGIPIIDCPAHLLGGSVYIDTKNDLQHFDIVTTNLLKQSIEVNPPPCSQTAYKCALIAAEAVNQMVLYFKKSRYACIDTHLDIDIYHHKYNFSDKYGHF